MLSFKWSFARSLPALALLLSACASAAPTPPALPLTASPTPSAVARAVRERVTRPALLDVLAGDAQFSTLRSAIAAADFGDTLAGAGPFTFFAPTDAAFAALPASLRDRLFDPEHRDELRGVLAYHLLPGSMDAATLRTLARAKSAQGEDVRIAVADDRWRVNDALPEQREAPLANGVWYAIDAVLLPPSVQAQVDLAESDARAEAPNLIEVAVRTGRLSTFLRAAQAADLLDVLVEPGQTVLAPDDSAFELLPDSLRQRLFAPEFTPTLRSLVLMHVLTGTRSLTDLRALPAVSPASAPTVTLAVSSTADGVQIGPARTQRTDITAGESTMHLVDRVLLPPGLATGRFAGLLSAGRYAIFARALDAAGLDAALGAVPEVTVLAPDDDAFDRLSPDTRAALFQPANAALMAQVLRNHIVPGRFDFLTMAAQPQLPTIGGGQLPVTQDARGWLFAGARVLQPDVALSGGVMHGIDTVLLPAGGAVQP